MNDKKIYVVTGKIKSGKTTKLFNFSNKQETVDGILAPIVNGIRYLYHIESKKLIEYEVENSTHETISVGKYFFKKKSFYWANNILVKSYRQKPNWLIIDEVGKLELLHEGLYPSIKEILNCKTNLDTKIVLVIRDYLLEEAIEFLKIKHNDYKLLDL